MSNSSDLSPFQQFCTTLPSIPYTALLRANLMFRADDFFPQDAVEEELCIVLALAPLRAAIDWLESLYHGVSADHARAAFFRLSKNNKGLVIAGYLLKYFGINLPPRSGRVWYSLFVVKDEVKSQDEFPVTSYQNAGIWPFFDRKTISPKEVAERVRLELAKIRPVSRPKFMRIGENGVPVEID